MAKPALEAYASLFLSALDMLANGMSKQEMLKEYPVLEPEDIVQCLNYAARSSK